MCREYTKGYNALFSVEESVLDRYTQALYNDPEFLDTYAHLFDDSIFHFLFPRPRLLLDGGDETRPAVLELDPVTLRIQASSVPTETTAVDSGALRITVRCPIGADPDTGNPVLKLTDTGEDNEYIEIEVLSPEEGATRGLIDSHIDDFKFIIAVALQLRIGDKAIPLDDIQGPLLCDASDPVVREDPSTHQDRDTLNLGLYTQSDPDTTRGDADEISYFLEDEKAITLQISSCLFSELVQRELDRTYMRFNLELSEILYSGGSLISEEYRLELSIYPSGLLRIEGLPSSQFANLRGTVSNPAGGDTAEFIREDDGTFSITLNASVGHVLEFHGDYFVFPLGWRLSHAHVSPPDSIDLENGQVRIKGDATVYIQGNNLPPAKVVLAYEAPIVLSIDPITGSVQADLNDAVLDIDEMSPILWFSLFGIGAIGQFITAICMAPVKNILTGKISESHAIPVDRLGLDAISSLVESSSGFYFFLESINVLTDGIILGAQLEAGGVESAGQRQLSWVRLTEEDYLGNDIRFVVGQGTVSCSVGVIIPTSSVFEQLGIDDIEELTASAQNSSVALSRTDMARRQVFVLRFMDRCAKVRVDPQEEGHPLIRWVTYLPIRTPSVSIHGDWESDISGTVLVPPNASVSGATRYWGEFLVSISGLHESEFLPDSPTFEWTIEPAYGRLEIDGSECMLEIIPAEDLPDDYPHRIELRVTATDIFGRTATTAWGLEAERLSWSSRGWKRARDFEFIRIDPHDPESFETTDSKVDENTYSKDVETKYSKGDKLAELLADAAVAAADAAAYAVAVIAEERSSSEEEKGGLDHKTEKR